MNCKPGELAFIIKVGDRGPFQKLANQMIGKVVRVLALSHDDVWILEPFQVQAVCMGCNFSATVLGIADQYLRPIRGEPEADETPTEIIEQLAPKRQLEHTR